MHKENILYQLFYLLFIACAISSCAHQAHAPIEFKGSALKNDISKYYVVNTHSQIKTQQLDITSLNRLDHQNIDSSKKIKQVRSLAQKKIIDKTQVGKSQNGNIDLDIKTSQVVEKSSLNEGFILPVDGRVIEKFNSTNQGIRIEATLTEPIKSIHDGQVIYAGYDNIFGNLVIMKLSQSQLLVAFAHLDDLFGRVGHQNVAVNVFFAEFVLNHGDFLAMRLVQDAFEHRGFASA